MKKAIFSLALAALLVAAAGSASAAGYAQGSFALTPQGGFYGAVNSNAAASFWTYGLDASYFVADGFELGLRGQGIYLNTRFTDPDSGGAIWDHFNGGGAEGLARWHFYRFAGDTGSVFAHAGLGALWFGDSTRFGWESGLSSGTQFSGVAGLGASFALANVCNVQVAGNWRHIGNFSANGIDGLGGTLALQFTF